MKITPSFPALLQAFFTDYLMKQRSASPHTIAAYRDSFRLLLSYAHEKLRKCPSRLQLEDLEAPFIAGFLDYLEKERHVTPRSRNNRLAAIHSFFHYLAWQVPTHAELIQRVLAIPSKRQDRQPVAFLNQEEEAALLAAPDQKTWAGYRDYTLLLLAIQTGLRVSELVGLNCDDVSLGAGAHVHCQGKGRKERCTPLTKKVAAVMQKWIRIDNRSGTDPLFPNLRRGRLTPDGVQYLLAKYLRQACCQCPSLKEKRVSPHVLRHTSAMRLLQAGVDRAVIAIWLGHEHIQSTQAYLHADLDMKESILAKTAQIKVRGGRYKPKDKLLEFLEGL